MRAIIAATTVITCLPFAAAAEERRIFFDVAMSSALLDRGRTAEFFAGAEASAGEMLLYATVYRLLPIGSDRSAFDNETDYSVGVIWEGQGYEADVSANWLTYPGEQAADSLELAASVSLDLPLAPGVAAFHDFHTDDWGLEVFGGPHWEQDAWTLYVLGRVGFDRPAAHMGVSRQALFACSRIRWHWGSSCARKPRTKTVLRARSVPMVLLHGAPPVRLSVSVCLTLGSAIKRLPDKSLITG